MFKRSTKIILAAWLLMLGGCTERTELKDLCADEETKHIFLPNYYNAGKDEKAYEALWQFDDPIQPYIRLDLLPFVQRVQKFDLSGFPSGSKSDYKIITYDEYEQLIHYIKVPNNPLLGISPKGTVIMLQGWSGNWNKYQGNYLNPMAEHFRRLGYELLLVNLRGHGLSEASKPYTAASTYGANDVLDINALLADIGGSLTKPLVVAGHSYGASAGTLLAIKNPDVKASINFSGLSTIDNVIQAVRAVAPDKEKVDMCTNQSGFLDALLSRAELDYFFKREDSSITNLGSESLDVPILLVGGTKDENVPIENLRQIEDSRQGSDVVRTAVYEDCDHWSYFNLNKTYEIVASFMSAVVDEQPMPENDEILCPVLIQ
ncbi:hypothetical protein CS022_18510 [Veronia nyctiphanis]|uniref:AB hydrolase-1 domain-containing protein n=1 Tax=Veronia nyctiphanis TaxID=1278244 RepID=A0A4Q0YMC1_9GAMM|nr:alpha/beta fold hydrolase [Veronia nyctiphanis]RXJ71992.1 hypothetical protein CS022_18510 [Veronia nyctiphanis]